MGCLYLPTFILLTIPKFLFHTGVFSLLLHLYFVRQWYSLHLENHDLRTEPIVILFFFIPRMKINIKGLLRLILTFSYSFIACTRDEGLSQLFLNFQWVKERYLLLLLFCRYLVFCSRTKSTISLTISSWDRVLQTVCRIGRKDDY
jgi:hypothetical protein